ncbi:hypothetical protein [Helicobacter pylori]|uniref:hypothetical protein n=1 Tax=Helicobacter pylori TaxID=210 RepID=UPI00041DEBE8|nr:hypothetical protein [Helicobacter pylori]WQU98687.1 urease-enhancing factor [Helicobacter pylori]
MKTIRNGVVVGVSLFGGCASVETRFDALRVACIKDAVIEKELRYTPKDFSNPYYIDQTDTRF